MSDFKTNSLLDLRKRLRLTSKITEQKTDASNTCNKHGDPLKVYCETCTQAICCECITNEHATHKFYLISECYTKHQRQIEASLDVLQQTEADVDRAKTHLTTRVTEVLQHGEQVKEEINTHAQKIIDMVQMSCTRLKQDVNTTIQRKTQLLTAQVQYAEQLQGKLKACQEAIERILLECTKQQILSEKHAMMEEINMVIQSVDLKTLVPIEKANTTSFTKTTNSDITIGHVAITNNLEAVLETLPCFVNQKSTASFTLSSQDGLPFIFPPTFSFICELISASDHAQNACEINQLQPGKYNITFTPCTRQDRLRVQIEDLDVPNSPFTLPVIPLPEMRGKPLRIISGFNDPWGIGVFENGHVVIAEKKKQCVIILDRQGRKVKIFIGTFTEPRGVAVSIDGHILVTDNHQLQKLTETGISVGMVGDMSCGNGQCTLNLPAGIAVHPTTGQIFVADSGNNRIQVFNNNLTFSHTITSKIWKRFSQPCDVALDRDGCLYVADFGNNCIAKLTTEGQFLARFGSAGHAPGQLYWPASIAVSNNFVYVCERCNRRVSIFDTDGNFLNCFGGEFDSPQGIAVDASGINLYVSDISLNTLSIF